MKCLADRSEGINCCWFLLRQHGEAVTVEELSGNASHQYHQDSDKHSRLEMCVCLCLCEHDISWSASQKHRGMRHDILTTTWQPYPPGFRCSRISGLVFFFFSCLHTASAETNSAILALVPLDPVLVKRRIMSCGGQNKLGDLSLSSIYPLFFVCFACLRVTYLSRSVLISEKCLHPDVTLTETWQEAHLATLDSHYAGFAWTLTSNSPSPFQMKTHTHTHTHTHRPMHVKPTLKKNKHLKL